MHYGLSVIAQCTGLAEDSKDAKLLFDKLYEDFVEAFDANDNGISVYDAIKLKEAGIRKRYNDRGYGIGAVVNRFNYHDKAEETKSVEELQEEEDQRFLRASAFTGEQFTSTCIMIEIRFIYSLVLTVRQWSCETNIPPGFLHALWYFKHTLIGSSMIRLDMFS